MGDITVHVWGEVEIRTYKMKGVCAYGAHTVHGLAMLKITLILICITLHSPHSVAGDLVH